MSFVPGDHEYGRWAVAAKWKHCDKVATQCGPYQRCRERLCLTRTNRDPGIVNYSSYQIFPIRTQYYSCRKPVEVFKNTNLDMTGCLLSSQSFLATNVLQAIKHGSLQAHSIPHHTKGLECGWQRSMQYLGLYFCFFFQNDKHQMVANCKNIEIDV